MICANNVLPVFIIKALLAPSRRGEQRAIQIRPSNELSETLMCQLLPGELGSANRTAVISSRYRSLHMSHVPVLARALFVQEFLNLSSSSMIDGSFTRARASAARCAMPPESWCG